MDDAFLEMMRTFRDYGVEDHFIPWPMVELENGYYPNTRTVDKFAPIMRANCKCVLSTRFSYTDGNAI